MIGQKTSTVHTRDSIESCQFATRKLDGSKKQYLHLGGGLILTQRCKMAKRNPSDESKCEGGHTDVFTCSKNPFTNEYILMDLVKYLPLPCLKDLRRVTEDGRKVVDNAIRRRQVVCLETRSDFCIYLEKYGDIPETGHRQFQINEVDFTGLLSTKNKTFWELFGPKIAMLEFTNREIFWYDIVNVVGDLPEITKLDLHYTPRDTSQLCDKPPPPVTRSIMIQLRSIPARHEDAVDAVCTMFRLFPRIQALSFREIEDEEMLKHVAGVLLRAIVIVDIKLENLKCLGVPFIITRDIESYLNQVTLPLQKLSIMIMEPIEHKILENFFARLSCTLTTLTILFPWHDPWMPSDWIENAINTLGSLSNLRFLRLFGACGNLCILKHLQVLEELSLKNYVLLDATGKYDRASTSDVCANQKINKISIETDDCTDNPDFNGQLLKSLLRICNNIMFLEIEHVNDQILLEIYLQMPQLKLLHLSNAKCTDAGVTGISAERLEFVSTLAPHPSDVILRDNLSIGCLQNLTTISIKGAPLTDRSIILGLCDCKRLTTICFQNAMITNTALKELRKAVGRKLVVQVTDCPLINPSENICHEKTSESLRSPHELPPPTKSREPQVREILRVGFSGIYPYNDNLLEPRKFSADSMFHWHSRSRIDLQRNIPFFEILGKIGAKHFKKLFIDKNYNDISRSEYGSAKELLKHEVRVPSEDISTYKDLNTTPTHIPQVFISRMLRSCLTIRDVYEWLDSLESET